MRKIIIDEKIIEQIKAIQLSHDYHRETGGILAGFYDTKLKSFCITDMSYPFPNDKRSRFRFYRNKKGHQEFMDELWKESGYKKAYLGEWHTHDQDSPFPSIVDIGTWKCVAKHNSNYNQSFFMIIGKSTFIIWVVEDGNVKEIKRG